MPHWRRLPLLLYGIVLVLAGLAIQLVGAVALVLTEAMAPGLLAPVWPGRLIIVSGGVMLAGIGLAALDLLVLVHEKRQRRDVMMEPPAIRQLTAVLTAFDDEESIGPSVDEFRAHPLVRRVIVVDNNSTDRTADVASEHGAIVVRESQQGYGRCVYRALQEGLGYSDT